MTIEEFEIRFKEKCKMEHIQIMKFNFNPDKKLLELELMCGFDLMPIPKKFDIAKIHFSSQVLYGTLHENNFIEFLDSFHV